MLIHNLIVGAVYVAMVLTPCVIALFSRADDADTSPESDAMKDGFI